MSGRRSSNSLGRPLGTAGTPKPDAAAGGVDTETGGGPPAQDSQRMTEPRQLQLDCGHLRFCGAQLRLRLGNIKVAGHSPAPPVLRQLERPPERFIRAAKQVQLGLHRAKRKVIDGDLSLNGQPGRFAVFDRGCKPSLGRFDLRVAPVPRGPIPSSFHGDGKGVEGLARCSALGVLGLIIARALAGVTGRERQVRKPRRPGDADDGPSLLDRAAAAASSWLSALAMASRRLSPGPGTTPTTRRVGDGLRARRASRRLRWWARRTG